MRCLVLCPCDLSCDDVGFVCSSLQELQTLDYVNIVDDMLDRQKRARLAGPFLAWVREQTVRGCADLSRDRSDDLVEFTLPLPWGVMMICDRGLV